MGYVLVALIFSKATNKKKQYKPLPGYKYEIHLDQLVSEEGTFGSIFGVIIESASYIYCKQLNLMPLTQSCVCDCRCVYAQAQ